MSRVAAPSSLELLNKAEAMSTVTKAQHNSFTFHVISSSHVIFMQLSSFLPLNGKTFFHPLSLLLQFWDHIIVFAFSGMWQGYGIRMILRGDLEIDFICEDIITTGFTLRYLVLCMKRKKLSQLVESCKKLWDLLEEGETIFVRQFERKAYYFRNFVMCNIICTTILYAIPAYIIRLPPLEANGTERKMLPFRFFMDVQEEPAYSNVFALQIIILLFGCLVFVSIDTVSLYLIMMACGYLRSVRNRLLSLRGDDSDTSEKGKAAFKVVVSCAHFHQQIMIFCKDIELLTRTLFLFACFGPIYNVSITAIVLITADEDRFKFLTILIFNFFEFFLYQWAPEYLTQESLVIAEAAYFASLQPLASSHRQKINRILYFMMMRAQKPVQLTAGGFVKLSIETFGAMTKNAFSFFMVLRNFRT